MTKMTRSYWRRRRTRPTTRSLMPITPRHLQRSVQVKMHEPSCLYLQNVPNNTIIVFTCKVSLHPPSSSPPPQEKLLLLCRSAGRHDLFVSNDVISHLNVRYIYFLQLNFDTYNVMIYALLFLTE